MIYKHCLFKFYFPNYSKLQKNGECKSVSVEILIYIKKSLYTILK